MTRPENERAPIVALVKKLSGRPQAEVEQVMAALDPAFALDVLRALTQGMQPQDRKRVMKIAQGMERAHSPEDDDDLHDFVLRECGMRIPRKAVCDGHCAPFDLMADVYFERGNLDKLAIGNRGSGKTQIVGSLHAVNARTKPKYTACTVGAVEAQATRAYNFFKEQVTKEKWARLVKGRVLMSGTEFENGAKVEIVIGNISGVNSPHPILGHFDEVELLREGVYEEGLNMAQSKNGYRAQNVLTSSWKKPKGFVSELIDLTNRAKIDGNAPPYEVYRWCVWETTERCDHDCSACPFADVVKGTWEDGSPRSFESACKRGSPEPGVGKLKFTDGFVTLEDSLRRFRTLGKRMWESQQESRRPSLEGLVYNCFDEDRHAVERWVPDPALGSVDVGLDFGGSGSYHAASFWQQLDVEVQWGEKRLPVGAHVCFDEVYFKDTGNVEFGRAVNARIEFWQSEFPDFEVDAFYGDPAAYAAREDFAALPTFGAGAPIRVKFVGHQDVEMGIALVFETISDDMVYIDRIRAEHTMDEIGGYERNSNTGKPVKDADHLMDALRYRFWTRHSRSRKPGRAGSGLRGATRPRAVTVSGDGRRWNPEAIGQMPEYHGAVEHDQTPLIAGSHRFPRDPFG